MALHQSLKSKKKQKTKTTPKPEITKKRKFIKKKIIVEDETDAQNITSMSDSEDVYFINTTITANKKPRIEILSDEEDIFFIGCKPGNYWDNFSQKAINIQ